MKCHDQRSPMATGWQPRSYGMSPWLVFFLMAISEIPLKNGGFRWENPALPRLITGGYIVQAG